MTVRVGMKFKEVGAEQVAHWINDPNVIMEQKMDGTRVLVVITQGKVEFLQSSGKVLAHTAATQHLDAVRQSLGKLVGWSPGELVLDGELLIRTGELYLFDAPYARFGGVDVVRPEMPFFARRRVLEMPEVRVNLLADNIKIVRQARTRGEKSRLFNAVLDEGAEGVMAKHADGAYEPGKRVGHSVKIKMVKTADVIVTEVNRPDAKHGSFTFGVVATNEQREHLDYSIVIDGLSIKNLGKCSAIGKPNARVGDVIEVAYLYRDHSGGLVQPRMMQVRPDKLPEQCTLDQFPVYSRKAVEF